jgi:valyl-tRNA synthetase
MLQSQEAIIIALTKGSGTAVFISDDSEVPQGCGTETVTADINVHIPVKGKVDAKAEIEKLEKKQTLAQTNKEKVVKVTQQANYETAVKPEVRATNQEKMEKLDAEIEALTQAMERFRSLL